MPLQQQNPISQSEIDTVKSPARRQFIALATAICGATLAGALYQPARADLIETLGKFLKLDSTVLNFAFAIEELEADFFNRLARSSGYVSLSGAERSLLSLCASQDQAHFEMLNTLRGQLQAKNAGTFETLNQSTSRRPRVFQYPPLRNREDILKTALDIKENALFTYHGAAALVRNEKFLGTAVAIAGVEGRHTAVLREMMGLDPVPAPFEGAITAQVAGRKFVKYGLNGGAQQ